MKRITKNIIISIKKAKKEIDRYTLLLKMNGVITIFATDVTARLRETKNSFEGEYASMISELTRLHTQGVPLGITVISKEKSFLNGRGKTIYLSGKDSVEIDLLSGNPTYVAEEFVFVIERFFSDGSIYKSTLKELLIRNLVEMMKYTREDDLKVRDITNVLRDKEKIENELEQLKKTSGFENIVKFFEREILGNNEKEVFEVIESLYVELEMINSALGVQKKPLDINKHFEKGGVVNFVVGENKFFKAPTISEVLAHFIVLKVQNAILRNCHETFKVPHFVFIENYSKYKNPDMDFIIQNEVFNHKTSRVSFNYTL